MKNLNLFENEIYNLTKFHYKNSKEYKKLIDILYFSKIKKKLEDIPFIPTKLFKEVDLKAYQIKKSLKFYNHQEQVQGHHQEFF